MPSSSRRPLRAAFSSSSTPPVPHLNKIVAVKRLRRWRSSRRPPGLRAGRVKTRRKMFLLRPRPRVQHARRARSLANQVNNHQPRSNVGKAKAVLLRKVLSLARSKMVCISPSCATLTLTLTRTRTRTRSDPNLHTSPMRLTIHHHLPRQRCIGQYEVERGVADDCDDDLVSCCAESSVSCMLACTC